MTKLTHLSSSGEARMVDVSEKGDTASVAALTIYNMAKSIDKAMTIAEIYPESKKSGGSGVYKRK